MQKLLIFFSKNISIYAMFNGQSFNGTLTNDIVSFEHLGSECWMSGKQCTPLGDAAFSGMVCNCE